MTVTLLAATVAMGLMAGLFTAYAYSVMPGLHRVDDRTFVVAMQRINVAIVNGWFLVPFLGALVLSVLAVVLYLDAGAVLPWIIVGLVLYLVTLGVTVSVNIPLNNQLMAAGDPDAITDFAAVRTRFERSWVRWNIVRAFTSTAAFVSLAWALTR